MGFGRVGRQLFSLVCQDARFDVVAISDIGDPDILRHLLHREHGHKVDCRLEGNYLVHEGGKTRMLSAALPGEIPWDLFDVDLVVDATNRFRDRESLTPHLDNGAARVRRGSPGVRRLGNNFGDGPGAQGHHGRL